MGKPKCKHIKENNQQCRAYVITGSEYCLAHDQRPETIKIREEAAKAAGLSQKILFPEVVDENKLPVLTKPINIKKSRDIKKAIIRTLQEVRYGKLDIEIGKTLIYGFNALVNCIDKIELLERIERLEKIAKGKGVLR